MSAEYERITVVKQVRDGALRIYRGWRRKAASKPRRFLDPDAQPYLAEDVRRRLNGGDAT